MEADAFKVVRTKIICTFFVFFNHYSTTICSSLVEKQCNVTKTEAVLRTKSLVLEMGEKGN